MKKILILSALILIFSGCNQNQQVATDRTHTTTPATTQETTTETINADWLANQLVTKFTKHNYKLGMTDITRLGPDYGKTQAISSLKDDEHPVGLVMFSNKHEMYGNDYEFKDAIERYSTDSYYGEVILEEMQIHPQIVLQYTKTSVMAQHSAMKNEYFFNLPNGEIVKVIATYNAEPDTVNEKQKEEQMATLQEIHDILTQQIES